MIDIKALFIFDTDTQTEYTGVKLETRLYNTQRII